MLWLFVVFGVAAFLATCDCQPASDFVRYDNYSAVAFDNVAGFFVPTAADCVAYSNIAPLTNGVVYNDAFKTCVVLTMSNNEIVITLRRNAGYVTYVKDISKVTRQIFKASVGSASNGLYSAYTNTTTSSITTGYPQSVASLNVTSSCSCVYRNDFVDYWKNNVGAASLVTVQMILGGSVVGSVIFNGAGTDYLTWYAPAGFVYAAPYSVGFMRTQTFLSFGIGTNVRAFSFYVDSGSCETDSYYFLNTYEKKNAGGCNYVTNNPPTLVFSYTKMPCNPGTAAAGFAEFFLISANIKSRVTLIN